MKYAIPCCSRKLRSRLATFCVAAAAFANVSAKELTFEQAFSDKGEPKTLHYQAVFTAKGSEHRLEVWRDGGRRLKRRTDETIEIYAFRNPGESEFHMSILDKKKRIHTKIDRTNLYRIGNFTDWFDLTHGLKHPMGEYRVSKTPARENAPRTIGACQWYDLTQDKRVTHICWSAGNRLPLAIETQEGEVVWKIAALDQKTIAENTFAIDDEGYIRNDANQDIEAD